MRRSVRVEAESGAFVLAPLGLAGRDAAEVQEKFQASRQRGAKRIPQPVLEGIYFPILLSSGKPWNVRVTDGPLLPDEDAQCVLGVTWKLRVPQGELLLCDGFGFLECSGDPGAYEGQGMERIPVPAGDWKVNVHGYLPGAIHDWQSAEGRPLGPWFRTTRPGEQAPDWLVQFFKDSPDSFDPGYEDFWRAQERTYEGVDRLDEKWMRYLSYVVQLAPLDREPREPRWTGYDCFEWNAERLDAFPVGIRFDA